MRCAAVLSRGIDPHTHAGTLNLFNRELTRQGVLPAFNKLLTGLQSAREAADYEAGVSFTLDEARSMLAETESFVRTVTELSCARVGSSRRRHDPLLRQRIRTPLP